MIYASNSFSSGAPGPWPASRPEQQPKTVTKVVLMIDPNSASNQYYNPITKSVTYTTQTCTTRGCSLNVRRKSLSRPLRIWRKQLKPFNQINSRQVSLNSVDRATASSASGLPCIQEDIMMVSECDGVKVGNKCIGGTNNIRRSASTIVNKAYCTTTREYLQKRVKSFDQNQLLGKPVSGVPNTYTSASGVEIGTIIDSGRVTGACNKIIFKPSNKPFRVQGGVSASARTNKLKYNTIIKNTSFHNYATAQATIDSAMMPVKDLAKQDCYILNRANHRTHIKVL
jgi:hypothetical protein